VVLKKYQSTVPAIISQGMCVFPFNSFQNLCKASFQACMVADDVTQTINHDVDRRPITTLKFAGLRLTTTNTGNGAGGDRR